MKTTNSTILLTFILLLRLSLPLLGQSEFPLETLHQKARDQMAEKVYVHLDRPTYLIGETVWFSMWVTDEQLKPSPISSIGYLE